MPRFPKSEAEIIALCQQIIAGLPGSNFGHFSVTETELRNQLDIFVNKRNEAMLSEASFRQDIVEKDSEMVTLTDLMKSVLRYAENVAHGDDAMLQVIGWGARAPSNQLRAPEQPRTLEAPKQGEGWVFLDWKEPVGGGAVAFYKIQRRILPAGHWADAASAIPSDYTLIEQPRGAELEYRIVSVNRAGESMPSNTVMVVL